ncbi:GNAT family N-acetyltransferase [Deinococcus yunweiensis]|uniref:GNAT family N-acetyltransferase n=1 Tax=Deinococcus yunweiensis TaxID=367282 RepID=UPI00398F49A2
MAGHVLDHPIWAALTGPHAHLAQVSGRARRYPRDISPFCAFEVSTEDAHRDVAALLAPGEVAPVFPPWPEAPDTGWQLVCQMVCLKPDRLTLVPPGLVTLGAADVPDMLALVEAARRGPFGPQTISVGRYIGVRDGGRLMGMAGERLHPPGHVEVSAVCTHPEYRGRGLAGALTAEVARGILARNLTPFLHVFCTCSRTTWVHAGSTRPWASRYAASLRCRW